jgi:hypothetical protein
MGKVISLISFVKFTYNINIIKNKWNARGTKTGALS